METEKKIDINKQLGLIWCGQELVIWLFIH